MTSWINRTKLVGRYLWKCGGDEIDTLAFLEAGTDSIWLWLRKKEHKSSDLWDPIIHMLPKVIEISEFIGRDFEGTFSFLCTYFFLVGVGFVNYQYTCTSYALHVMWFLKINAQIAHFHSDYQNTQLWVSLNSINKVFDNWIKCMGLDFCLY